MGKIEHFGGKLAPPPPLHAVLDPYLRGVQWNPFNVVTRTSIYRKLYHPKHHKFNGQILHVLQFSSFPDATGLFVHSVLLAICLWLPP